MLGDIGHDRERNTVQVVEGGMNVCGVQRWNADQLLRSGTHSHTITCDVGILIHQAHSLIFGGTSVGYVVGSLCYICRIAMGLCTGLVASSVLRLAHERSLSPLRLWLCSAILLVSRQGAAAQYVELSLWLSVWCPF